MSEVEKQEAPKPSSGGETGLDPKVSSMLAYLLGIIGGIIFYAISKDSYVRFHAMQSILLSIAIAVIYGIVAVISLAVPFFLFIDWFLYLGVIAIWILMMLKAYNGERYKLPLIGDMAEKFAK